MNCFSSPGSGPSHRHRRFAPARLRIAAGLAASALCPSIAHAAGGEYGTIYTITIDTTNHAAKVELALVQNGYLLREARFQDTGGRYSAFEGDGELIIEGDEVTWHPPASGGSLSWNVSVAHRRNGDGYDAWIGDDWGLFRAEDVIPRAATRTLRGAKAAALMRFETPDGWSVVTEYAERGGEFPVDDPARRFDQPGGWIVMGRLGVRRDRIAGVRVAVAGPVDNGIRRLDMLALLNWTMPEMARIAPRMPERLTIVSAAEPMWRGGLSAPSSLYIHADRPLISENGTSTLLHEVMHVVMGLRARRGYDWIVEGLAEYFTLELLHRSGTLSDSRLKRAEEDQREWSESATALCGGSSTGARTALAVSVFMALDEEIRSRSNGKLSVDDLVTGLMSAGEPVDLATLDRLTGNLLGGEAAALNADNLPGCH